MRSVNVTESCWLWTGMVAGTKSRYGYFRPGTKSTDRRSLAHRWAYERWVGPIPEGLQVDHTCRQPLCVRPEHLEPVTAAENMRRARQAVCDKGLHDLTDPANRRGPDRRGRERGCKPCRQKWDRDRRKK